MSRPMFSKREVGEVLSVKYCTWKAGYALVVWQELMWPDCPESRPIKIQRRKDGTEFISFEGKRYNIGYGEKDVSEQVKRLTDSIFGIENK